MSGSIGLISLTPAYATILLLMVVRVSAMIVATPIFGARTVPAMSKIGLALLLSFILLPIVAPKAVLPPSFGHLLLAVGKELLIGLVAGFAVTLVYTALQLVASLAGMQMGFGFSNMVDASFTGQTPVLDHLFTGMATLIFLSGNFHHQFLIGVKQLFDAVPPNLFPFFESSPDGLIALSGNMFVVAMRIVLPLLGTMLLTDLALGILARTAPQMNVFFVGLPAKIAVGIFTIALTLPFVVNSTEALFSHLVSDMLLVVR